MSITSDQILLSNNADDEYLFKFFSDDVCSSSSLEYSSEASNSSPQTLSSSSPENCIWDPFELNPFDTELYQPSQVKKEEKPANPHCLSNYYQPITTFPCEVKSNNKETGKKAFNS